jgi:hypothetical protein
MLPARLLLVGCAFALCVACKNAPAPTTVTRVVALWMNGAKVGEERATLAYEGQRTTIETRTSVEGTIAIQLEGRLAIERGRPTSLRVAGDAPDRWPLLVDVTVTPDRTDVFPLRGVLPVHVLSTLVRQSVVGARRRFHTPPEGTVSIETCQGREGPFADAICHAVIGLPSGPALVWIDERQQLTAAVVQTPFGAMIATTPARDGSRPALLERFDVYSRR